jgi:O-antigen ligase
MINETPACNNTKDTVNGVIYFFMMMFLITVSFSTFLSNFGLYSAIAALLYARAAGKIETGFKYHKIYPIMLIFIFANIIGLFTSGLGIAKIENIKNVMAFLAFFLAYEKGALLIDKLKMIFTLQITNFIMLITAIITTALNLTDIVYLQDFVNWPVKYSGLFEVPITYGEFLVMLQCLSIAILLGAKGAFKSGLARGFFIALITANMLALILTYSRGPWAAMLIALSALLFLNRYYKTLGALFVISVLALLMIIYPPVENNQLLNDINLRVTSTLKGYSSGREVIYAAGFKMIEDNPLLGVGIGGVEKNYAGYVNKIEWAPPERKQMVYGHLHNLYLQVYAETGLIGFAAFIWLCAYLLYSLSVKSFKMGVNCPELEKAYAAGALIAFASVLIMGFSEYNMFNNEISRILWFYAGMALGAPSVPNRQSVTNEC